MIDTFITSASGKQTILKSPIAVLDYPFNWSDWLTPLSDTILSHQVSADAASGLTVEDSVVSGQNVIVWLSGGVSGQTGSVTCRVTTVGGRTDQRTFYVKLKDR
jgi:hypothetical protein